MRTRLLRAVAAATITLSALSLLLNGLGIANESFSRTLDLVRVLGLAGCAYLNRSQPRLFVIGGIAVVGSVLVERLLFNREMGATDAIWALVLVLGLIDRLLFDFDSGKEGSRQA